MARIRVVARLVALLGWLLVCVSLHLLARLAAGGSRWPRRFLAGMAWICGARVRCQGGPVAPHTLLVSNHVSWLDIPVFSAATGGAFIAKAELRRHPLMRWLADQNASIYVDRADRGGIRAQADAILAGLAHRQPLVLFAEGTVGVGGAMLPFRPALFSAVAPPPANVAVRPVAVDYGAAAALLAWTPGEAGIANALRVLALPAPIPVTVRILPPLPVMTDRKALALAAQDAVGAALGASAPALAAL